ERVTLEIEDEVECSQSPDRKGGVQVQSLRAVAGSALTYLRGSESEPLFPKGKSVLPPSLSRSQALPGNALPGGSDSGLTSCNNPHTQGHAFHLSGSQPE